jgi:hypothetical protein
MHVGVEARALLLVDGHQVDAKAGRAVASGDRGEWLFGDSHWLHPVRRNPYNLSEEF